MATHKEVAQGWITQSGKHRKGHHMYYEGDTIYSYGSHFPIARLLEHEGHKVCLFTTATRSVSTAKHKGIVRGALIGSKYISFNVPLLSRISVDEKGGHEYNYQSIIRSAKEHVQKSMRARKYTENLMFWAEDFLAEANKYNEVFGLGYPEQHIEYIIALVHHEKAGGR